MNQREIDMKQIKITDARYEEDRVFTYCLFKIDGKQYHLSAFGDFKPVFLRAGLIPLYTEWYGGNDKVDPILVVRDHIFKGVMPSSLKLTDHPKILRLAFIHFLDNMAERDKSGPIEDKLDIRELAEFGMNYSNDDFAYPEWIEIVKKVWNTTI